MAGKDKTELGMTFSFDDSGGTLRNLTASLVPGSCAALGFIADEISMHGVAQAQKNFLSGWLNSDIAADFLADNTATTGSYTVLCAGGTFYNGTLTIKIGSNGAAPTTGDIQWSGEYVLLEATMKPSSGAMVISAKWKPTGATPPAWSTI